MPLQRETNYKNRYLPSKRFFEWRNLAGEVPQAAELNEIQSLAKDLVQRAGDSILQNGDIIEGMYVESRGTASGIQYYDATLGGKIWIDGTVHNVPGGAKDLPVPTSGWGFIGVYLQKDLIDSVADSSLFDPAILDSNGTALGLPGANRMRVTPIWVAGTLPVSEFDDVKVKNLKVLPNSSVNSSRLTVEVNTTESISANCVYNAKISFPTVYSGDTTTNKILAYSEEEYVITPGSSLNASVKVSGANNNTLKAYVQLFFNGFEVLGSVTEVALTNNTVVNLTLNIPNDLSVLNKYNIGVVFKTTSSYINPAAVMYVSDLHLLKSGESRKPRYKTFTTAFGSQYSNFMVGTSSSIKHGNFTLGDISKANTSSINDITLPASINSLDKIIRDTQVTETMDTQFLQNYGLSIEEAFIRVYPVHITYNGNIVSSLPNREFSRLVDRLLSERIGKVVSSSVIEGLTVNRISDQVVSINPGNAFVNGRLFVGKDETAGSSAKPVATTLTLPSSSDSNKTITEVEVVGFDRFGYTRPAEAYKVRAGSFTALTKVTALCLFKETITHKSNPQYSERPFIPDLTVPVGDLDKLALSAVSVLKVQNVATQKVYRRGWDWDLITRVQQSGDSYTPLSVIGWHTYDADPTNGEPVGSDEPANNARYDVYYTAEVELTLPSNNSDLSQQIKYLREGDSNVSFDIKTITGTLDTVTGTKLDSWTAPSGTIEGPFLKISNVNVSFTGYINVYSYTVQPQNSYVVYLSGNVLTDGPDGSIGYTVIGGGQGADGLPPTSAEDAVKSQLLREQKLPLARVTVPVTDETKIVNYSMKMINLADQQSVNNKLDDLLELLPALLSQNLLAGDKSGNNFSYVDSADSSSQKLLKTVTWKVDSNAFPVLKNYTVDVIYSYFGEDPDLRPQYPQLPESEPYNTGLLRGMIAEIKDPGGTSIKKLVVNLVYDSSTLDIISSESEVV